MDDWNGTFELIDPRLIVVDHRYQRPEKEYLIARISSKPDWAAFGVLTCFRRPNGVYYCADGQQRLRGVLQAEKPPRTVPVFSFHLDGVEDEARVFAMINEWRKSLSSFEKHVAKLVAKDPAALAIDRAVEKAGFSISNDQSSRSVQAVAALQHVYNQGGEEAVLQTMTLIRSAWPDDRYGTTAHLVRVIGEVVASDISLGVYDRQERQKQLAKTSPSAVLRKAEEIHFDQGTSRKESIRRAFRALAKFQELNGSGPSR